MTQLLTSLRTVPQKDMQQGMPKDGGLWSPNAYRNNKGRIRVRPLMTYVISEKELATLDRLCLCTIVWHNVKGYGQTRGWRELKFIHRNCPYHHHIECGYEICT